MKIEVVTYPDGGSVENHLNNAGTRIRTIDKEPDGTITLDIKYAIQENQLCVGWTVCTGSGQLIKKFVVDRESVPVMLLQYGWDGQLEAKRVWDGE